MAIVVPGWERPAIVYVHKGETFLQEAETDECLSLLVNGAFVVVAFEGSPCAPAHVWGQTLAVVQG